MSYVIKLVCGPDTLDLNDLTNIALVPDTLDLTPPEATLQDDFAAFDLTAEDLMRAYSTTRTIQMTLEFRGAPNDVHRMKYAIGTYLSRARQYRYGTGNKVELHLRSDRIAPEPTFGRSSVRFEIVGGELTPLQVLSPAWVSGAHQATLRLVCRPLGYSRTLPVGLSRVDLKTGPTGELAFISPSGVLAYAASSITSLSTFSVSFWTKVYDTACNRFGSSVMGPTWLQFYRASSSRFSMEITAPSTFAAVYVSSGCILTASVNSASFPTDRYIHFGSVYSAGSLWLYQDGVLVASAAATQGSGFNITSAPTVVHLGGEESANPENLSLSWISDFRTWDGQVLAASDMDQLYDDGRGPTELPYMSLPTQSAEAMISQDYCVVYNGASVMDPGETSYTANYFWINNVLGDAPAGMQISLAMPVPMLYSYIAQQMLVAGISAPETTGSSSFVNTLVYNVPAASNEGTSSSPNDVWGTTGAYKVIGSPLSTTGCTIATFTVNANASNSLWMRGSFRPIVRFRNESPNTCGLQLRYRFSFSGKADAVYHTGEWVAVPTTPCVWYAIDLGSVSIPRQVWGDIYTPDVFTFDVQYKVTAPCNNSYLGLDAMLLCPEYILLNYKTPVGASGVSACQAFFFDTISDPPTAARLVNDPAVIDQPLTPYGVHWAYLPPKSKTFFLVAWTGSRGDTSTSAGNWVYRYQDHPNLYKAQMNLRCWIRPRYYDIR